MVSTRAQIPSLITGLPDTEIRRRLDAASRKGRLPGLRVDADGSIFEIREIGRPFDSVLEACRASSPAGIAPEADVHRIEFRLRLRPIIPTVFAAMLIVSVWPGIYLVDSMLRHYFTWYASVNTWWWYMPLNVATSPWAFWSALKKSRASAMQEATDLAQKVAKELGAQPAPPRA